MIIHVACICEFPDHDKYKTVFIHENTTKEQIEEVIASNPDLILCGMTDAKFKADKRYFYKGPEYLSMEGSFKRLMREFLNSLVDIYDLSEKQLDELAKKYEAILTPDNHKKWVKKLEDSYKKKGYTFVTRSSEIE